MISLVNGGTLTIKLGGAATSVNPYFSGSYVDSTIAGGITVDTSFGPTQTNGVTPVTVFAAPAAGTTRHMTGFSLTNTDTGAITLSLVFGGQVLFAFTMAIGDVLQYGKSFDQFTVVDSSGRVKGVVTGVSVATGKTLTVNNSLTLSGTDGTVHTFPSVTSTLTPAASPVHTGPITRSGTGSPATLVNLAMQAYDTIAGVFQNNIQNISNNGSASSDLVATADTGTDSTNYCDLGINSSAYNDAAYTIGAALASYLLAVGGDLTVGTATAAKTIKFHTAGTLAANLRATISDSALTLATGVALAGAAAITSSGGGVGYATGAGGTVTQGSSRTTTVVNSKLCGNITMFSAAQAADALVTFTLTNTFIAATDFLAVQHISATNGGAWAISTVCGSGSATINIRNVSNASITEATPLRFTLIKGVTA